MKYVIYQVVKYFIVFIFAFVLIVYLAKTDRIPRFIPDDIRNGLVDFSDYVLSYEYFRVVYSPIESVIDFLADDGYVYAYNTVPKIVVERLDNEIKSAENIINLFLNNPLFETWIVPNIVSSDGILKETFKNYFSEDFYTGFVILSSKFVDVFSLNFPKDENIRYLLNSSGKLKFYSNYVLVIRKLSRDLDFIEGFFVLVLDKKKFFDRIFDGEKSIFEIIYIVQGNNVVYSSKDVPYEYLRDQHYSDFVQLFGDTFKQSVVDYGNMKICFVLSKPSWVRWIYVFVKLLLFGGIIVLLFFINRSIKMRLKQSRDIRYKFVKELKSLISDKTISNSSAGISNLLVKTTEDNLKFFENFVEQDVKSMKDIKKRRTSIFR